MISKRIAALTAAVLAAGLISVFPVEAMAKTSAGSSASTEKTDEASMKKALTLFKSRITIPKEYSEFDYSTNQHNYMQSYHFSWSKPGSYTGNYSATVTGGMITSYDAPYTKSSEGSGYFAAFSAKELQNKALQWIYKANPEMKGRIRLREDISLNLHSKVVTLNIERINGSVKVNSNNAHISLNKITGEVISFSCSWWQNASFPDSSKALTQEQIKKVYAGEVKLKPWYRLKYNYDDISTAVDGENGKDVSDKPKITACLVYVPENSFVYNALTGKHTTMNEDFIRYQGTDMYDDVVTEEECDEDMEAGVGLDDNAPMVELTEEELAAIETMKGMLTEKQFREKLKKDPYINITDKYLTSHYNIYASEAAESGYMISSSFSINNKNDYCTYNIQADAKSGKVYSFSSSGMTSEKALNVSEANKLAEKAAKYYYGDIFGKYKADISNTAPAVKTEDYTETVRTFCFYRYENNIQVAGNMISVTVDSSGRVRSVSKNHTEDVDFGSGKIISSEKALEMLFKQKDMNLVYEGFTDLKSVPHTYLHYTIDNWTLNAKTGKLGDYYGDPITEIKTVPALCPYTDIEKSPYKNEIITLYNNGLRFYNEAKLDPSKTLTTYELNELINIRYSYMPYEASLYDNKDKNGKPLTATRADLAKLFVEKEGLGRCAEIKGIYKSPFKDVKDSDKNVGYFAIAKGIGIITGDKNGNISPNAPVTREYALHCIYNWIKNSKDNGAEVYEDEVEMEEVEYVDPGEPI